MLMGKFMKGRKNRFLVTSKEFAEPLGPKDWEEKMTILSYSHKDVRWRRHNLIVGNYNQAAYKKLNGIRYSISEVSSDIIALIPSARWLFDNFQMMYREIKKVKTTGTSYEMLPILQSGEDRGFPRIYVVAREMIALTGGYLTEENITLMMQAYQKNQPLSDKELWSMPEMIGLCLLKRIIEVSEDIVCNIRTKSQADNFVKERLKMKSGKLDITPLLHKLGGDCHENLSFHCHVIYLLKNMSVEDESIQRYIDFHCKAEGRSANPSDIFKEEGRIESLLESKIRTLIVSLREVNQMDEEKLFEKLSRVEHILSRDPAGVYPGMDAESRGVYRQVVEKLALRYKVDDGLIGEACLELAAEGREDIHCSRHVGAYLIGKGYPILKAKIRKKKIPAAIAHKNGKKLWYGAFITAALAASYWLLFLLIGFRRGEPYQNILLLLVATPIVVGIALEFSNSLFTRLISVKKIPSMDYLTEIPDEARTFVVMPVIISSVEQGLEYLERLHNHYLANRQSNLYFALLADHADAPELTMPDDDLITKALVNRIHELNARYPSEHQIFSLFFRYRKWNESEGYFMCWERKRGKLEEFNAWLTGTPRDETSFSLILTDEQLRRTFKYVITLDADSCLVRDNASKLVGMIDHPMNRAVLDSDNKKVEEGYAIIQPSVRNHINGQNSSAFPKIAGGQEGLIHYSSVISDIYQDVFQEGSYIGKGIYNVEAFYLILHKQIPENRVLSHDLLESCYAKTAFTGAANIMDDFPGTVLSYAKREHRWIRGDWQLLPWLLDREALSRVSRWKILDNMRRSLLPLCKVLFILLNLAFFPESWYAWLPVVFFSDLFNLAVLLAGVAVFKTKRPRLAIVHKRLRGDVTKMLLRAAMEIMLAPYKAFMASDAILRTLYRIAVSKKSLLKWNPSEVVEKSISNTRKGYFLHMWTSLIPAAILAALLIAAEVPVPGIILHGILAAVWALSFLFAWKISQPVNTAAAPVEEDLLRETARRTWRFFKDFSIRENNWLCPDNYQITSKQKITRKTSPTNIGLQFLSILSARDFGFETLSTTLDDIENLLYTVITLPKWNGHLYNWYNIKTMEVLPPQYISTVDSGNFFGDMITLKNGLLEQKKIPVIPDSILSELQYRMKCCGIETGPEWNFETYGQFAESLDQISTRIAGGEERTWEEYRMAEDLTHLKESLRTEVELFRLEDRCFADKPTLRQLAQEKCRYASELIETIDGLCAVIDNMLEAADFSVLYTKKRMLFHIGYHVSSQTPDLGCYDLLASESLLTSFLTIARGEIPVKHWYKLARPLTMVNGVPAFVSWSGTMFEYLMPNLILREYDSSVFSETARAAVRQHILYGSKMHIPWGISESQYYRFDLDSNYQYKAFGVPELRLQPSVSNSLVVAPYATMLALEFAGEEAQANLKRLAGLGAFGEYGFYESIDFNGPDPVGLKPYCIVKSFMAHHQGMSLVAIDNFLNRGVMRRRFHSEPIVKATEILLEEKRQTYFISITKKGYTVNLKKVDAQEEDVIGRRYIKRVSPPIPAANYLSNNKYSLMITSDGDGFSDYMGMMLYRWRADVYANTGSYIYIKELKEGRIWSAAYHPTKAEPDEYQAIFSPHEAEFRRRDGDVSTHTQVCVSPSHNLEIRKLTFTNHGKTEKQLEITSYLEVVGDRYVAELGHPAFNKLFIESEFLAEGGVFLSRRRSSGGETNPYLMHMAKSGRKPFTRYEYENDRLRFIGRNNTLQNPAAVTDNRSLPNRAGFSSDPIMSLRVELALGPEETASVSFIAGVCESREEALKLSGELIAYRIDDLFEKARLQSEMELKYLNITKQQVNAFQDLISPIFYPCSYYRGPVENIRRNWKNQSFLWRFGVSGDNPVMLLRVSSIEEAGIIKDVLKAYEYLRINQVKVDLIILSEAKHGYMQELTDLLNDMVSSLKIYDEDRDRPSLFILHSYQMVPAEIDLLFTVARIVFSEQTGIYFRNIREALKETDEE